MNGSQNSRKRKKTRNTAVRLLAAILIIVSVFIALDSFGFFNKTVDYSPTSVNYYHSSVTPSGDPSYRGCEQLSTVSEGSEENNNISFNDGLVGARTKRTEIVGGGQDVFTVMIYMCAGDMESSLGLASADIAEMLEATRSSKLNIIIQTGGSPAWENTTVKANRIQRFKIEKGKLRLLASGNDVKMSNYANLTSFILYCKEKYPANRYALVLWGHGGGTVGGYSYDESNTTADSMTIDELNQALYAADVNFDFIGFDAGLMANYDTAHTVNFYADYLIASQETMPSVGWNYTNWLSAIAENTSIETTEIAQIIIDDYYDDCRSASENYVSTLSLIDLADFNNLVCPAMAEFSSYIDELINNGKYSLVANARAASREFGGASADMIDLMEFAERLGSDECDKLIDALETAIKYNAVSKNVVNANGLSVYFPYRSFDKVNLVMNIYHRINICSEYSYAIRKFANITVGGQTSPASVSGDISGLTVSEISSPEYKWLDKDFVESCSAFYKNNSLSSDTFMLEQKVSNEGNSYTVFSLSRKEWSLVSDVFLEAYVYDSESGYYLALGTDIPELTYLNSDKLHLLASFSGAWLSIDGVNVYAQVASYEEYDTVRKITYRVPVYITSAENGTESTFKADLFVTRDNRYADTYSIAYAQKVYENGETETQAKTFTLTDGDIITPCYEYFDSDLNPISTPVSDANAGTITYTPGITVCMDTISADDVLAYYVFSDVYGNKFRAEVTDTSSDIK